MHLFFIIVYFLCKLDAQYLVDSLDKEWGGGPGGPGKFFLGVL